MAKLAFRGLIFATMLAAAACGGGKKNNQVVFTDGGPGGDGGGGGATCNPVAQTGCAAGEKCASVTVQASPPIVQTLCVPDGDKAEGEACTNGMPGPSTGYDDCQAFNECIFGVCRPACRQQGATVAGTCDEGDICQIFNGLYDDLDTDDVGICIPGCDPTQGLSRTPANGPDLTVDYTAQCGDTLQCFMNVFDGIGVCAAAFEGSPGPGEECPDDNGDGMPDCALNGCAPGSGPWLPGGSLTDWQGESVFFANSIFNLANTCIQFCDTAQGLDGNPQCPAANECRYVTGLYLNFDTPDYAPDGFGLCVPTQNWGSCADNVISDVGAYLIPEGSDPAPDGIPGTNNFIPGCNTGAEVMAEIDACTADPPTDTCADPVTAFAPTSTGKTSSTRTFRKDVFLAPPAELLNYFKK